MARTARFAWDNRCWDTVTVITASASATGYPATGLANPARWVFWRSTTTTGNQNLDFDLGSSQSMQCFLLNRWKAHTGGGTIKVQAKVLSGDPYLDKGTFTLPSPNPTGVIAIWLGASISMRFVRFLFTNTGAVSDYVEAGGAFVGTYFQPAQSIDRGYEIVPVDPSVERVAIGGQRSAVTRPSYFRVEHAVLPTKPDTDRVTLTTMVSTVGNRRPLYFAIDPDDPGYFTYFGHFEAPPRIAHVAVQRWSFPFTFVEDVG